MGLDMYLDVKNHKTNSVTNLICWRKAEQIKGWFINNTDCPKYTFNTDIEVTVTEEQILNLLQECYIAWSLFLTEYGSLYYNKQNNAYIELSDNSKCVKYAREHFPIYSLFKNNSYDIWYFEDMKYTIDGILNNVLPYLILVEEDKDIEFVYREVS